MDGIIDPIIPRRWIPVNDREQAPAEAVVKAQYWVAGQYTDRRLDGLAFKYEDKREQQWYSIQLEQGVIYLTRLEGGN